MPVLGPMLPVRLFSEVGAVFLISFGELEFQLPEKHLGSYDSYSSEGD